MCDGVVHYVVVVHGIGEPRRGETLLEVVSRFAKAFQEKGIADAKAAAEETAKEQHGDWKKAGKLAEEKARANSNYQYCKVHLSEAITLSNSPWVQFPEIECAGKNGTPPSSVRFSEVYWSDILTEAGPEALMPVSGWAKVMTARMKREGSAVPRWALEWLTHIEKTATLLDRLLAWKEPAKRELFFDKYLGDVQMYGEYAKCSGKAVERFHAHMANIVKTHKLRSPGTEPKILVLAHSLGTVLSFESLTRAATESAEHPWLGAVRVLITMGSPVDKFLTLWPKKFKYLATLSGDPPKQQICHYNYCEEQDIVGGPLDGARGKKLYDQVFVNAGDSVYAHSPWPLLAHVAYWKDDSIYARAIAAMTGIPKPTMTDADEDANRNVSQLLIYIVLPFMAAMVTFYFLQEALGPESGFALPSALAAAIGMLLFQKLIDVSIWWREVAVMTVKYDCPKQNWDGQQRSIGTTVLLGFCALLSLSGVYAQGSVPLYSVGIQTALSSLGVAWGYVIAAAWLQADPGESFATNLGKTLVRLSPMLCAIALILTAWAIPHYIPKLQIAQPLTVTVTRRYLLTLLAVSATTSFFFIYTLLRVVGVRIFLHDEEKAKTSSSSTRAEKIVMGTLNTIAPILRTPGSLLAGQIPLK